MSRYNQEHIQRFYNTYGEQETRRWEKSPVEQVKFHVHRHYLQKHVQPGDRVLELGAGTGMFTRELAPLVSEMVVTDLSPVQLKLNQQRAQEERYEQLVTQWAEVDICDLSQYPTDHFDAVVCYGGPLSYVFEKKGLALREMKRVLRPQGTLLISVMNLWGTVHEYMHKIILPIAPEDNEKVMTTGDLHPDTFTDSDHHCHMFRATEFRTDLKEAGFKILDFSASNCLSALRGEEIPKLKQEPNKWAYFLDLEIRASASPGMVESGTHLIAVGQKTNS